MHACAQKGGTDTNEASIRISMNNRYVSQKYASGELSEDPQLAQAQILQQVQCTCEEHASPVQATQPAVVPNNTTNQTADSLSTLIQGVQSTVGGLGVCIAQLKSKAAERIAAMKQKGSADALPEDLNTDMPYDGEEVLPSQLMASQANLPAADALASAEPEDAVSYATSEPSNSVMDPLNAEGAALADMRYERLRKRAIIFGICGVLVMLPFDRHAERRQRERCVDAVRKRIPHNLSGAKILDDSKIQPALPGWNI